MSALQIVVVIVAVPFGAFSAWSLLSRDPDEWRYR